MALSSTMRACLAVGIFALVVSTETGAGGVWAWITGAAISSRVCEGLVRMTNGGGGYRSVREPRSSEGFEGVVGGLSEASELVDEGRLILDGSPDAMS